MKAIAVVPGTKIVQLVERPEPSISEADEIKVRVLRVGICGTDRAEAAGGRAQAPPSHKDLVLGHEMFRPSSRNWPRGEAGQTGGLCGIYSSPGLRKMPVLCHEPI